MVRSVSSATVSALKPPALVDRFGAPRAQRAGDDGNAIQQIEGALFEILAGHVFERLPAREPADAVSDLHVAGDGADPGIDEVPHEFAHRVGLDRGVGVDGDEDAAGSFGQGMRKRRGLSAIGLVNHAHGGIASELFIEQFARCRRSNRRRRRSLPASDNRIPAPS